MTIIGMKRDPSQPRKPMNRGGFLKRSGRLKFSGNTKRGRENRGCYLLKKLLIQEYHDGLAIAIDVLKGWDLEHIWGKNWPGFELGATLDFLNVQLVPRDQHNLKTNATAKTTSETGIMARLISMRDRVLTRLKANGGAWTLAEQLKVYRKELRK